MTLDEVITILSEVLYIKPEKLNSRTKLESIVQDSMDIVELVAVFSNRYKIAVDQNALRGIKTIGQLTKYINKNSNTKKSATRLEKF